MPTYEYKHVPQIVFRGIAYPRNEGWRFVANCEICGRTSIFVHWHHLVPKRIRFKMTKKCYDIYAELKIKVCDDCNKVLHPENELYAQIQHLRNKLRME